MSSDSGQLSSGASSYASDSDVEVRLIGGASTSKKRKSTESSEAKRLGVSKAKKFKSASVVASSDIEDDIPYDPVNPFVFGQGSYISHQKPLDSERQGPSAKSKSLFSDNEDSKPEKKSTPLKPKAVARDKQRSKPKSKPVEDAGGSGDSNMENKPPISQKKTTTKEKESKSSRAPSTKKVADKKPSDKDDATIKRLKSLVLACGVRKPWAKLFEGVDRPSQQIKTIKDILTELGMKGRMSMEQAKAIREKREMEQELADVQSFEKSFVSRSSRSRATAEKKAVESDQDDSDEEITEKPVKRKMSARQSIMAFLGDDSE
ncbi:uncharacterized protein EV420DRAFT_655659 [Desarmillaria tabescens]|uniref:Uncharacterized protein n=1 Tax=Armillaria tabescens TaxID=1929756 RepID=A0AA39NJS2_ARMTA|nr:uncharacterized protein EV420DRAFT_655659 [Desarmillaria tabescens]KAK0466936.1 hypothetical protein EV420DRAFT_655659 [Desarmillaria tabescens]